jgi:hypothetical protein
LTITHASFSSTLAQTREFSLLSAPCPSTHLFRTARHMYITRFYLCSAKVLPLAV